ETSDVRQQLPDLLVREAPERRHLAATHAFSNRMEHVAVLASAQRTGIERRTAIPLSGRSMTRLACLVVDPLAVDNRCRIRRKRIAGHIGLLGEQTSRQAAADASAQTGGDPSRYHKLTFSIH